MYINDAIRNTRNHLAALELTAATYGINTPPEISIEILVITNVLEALVQYRGSAKTGRYVTSSANINEYLRSYGVQYRIPDLSLEYAK